MSDDQELPDLLTWPTVPVELRPKKLFISHTLKDVGYEALEGAGYDVVDVRLMPTNTMAQRQEAVLGWLEGVRLGSVVPPKGAVKYVECEARACGLLKGEPPKEAPKKSDGLTVDEVLRNIERKGRT